jgi:hypothetical protein
VGGEPWVASTRLDGEYEIFDAAVERVLEASELEALRYAPR